MMLKKYERMFAVEHLNACLLGHSIVFVAADTVYPICCFV